MKSVMRPETESPNPKKERKTICRISLRGHIIDSREASPLEAASAAEQREAVRKWCSSLPQPLQSIVHGAFVDHQPTRQPDFIFSRAHIATRIKLARNIAKVELARFKSDF